MADPDPIDIGAYRPGPGTLEGEPQALYFSDKVRDSLRRNQRDSPTRFVIPEREFKGHAILVGQSGSGKSETLLRIIGQVVKHWNWQVVVVDAKADAALRTAVAEIAERYGKQFGAFPDAGYDIWNGEPIDVATRLLELIPLPVADRPLAHRLLAAGVSGGPAVASSGELLLNNLRVAPLPAGRAKDLNNLLIAELEAFFAGPLGAILDGPQQLATRDLFYFGIDAMRYPYAAAGVAAAILRDIADFVVRRKDRQQDRTMLLVFDEFSAVPVEVATDLVERIRSFNVQVILGIQSSSGLGPHGARLAEAANWLFLQRTSRPEPFTALLGEYVDGSRKPLVEPLVFRRLQTGHVIVAHGSRVAGVAVARWSD